MSRSIQLVLLVACFVGMTLSGLALLPTAEAQPAAELPADAPHWEYFVQTGPMAQSAMNKKGAEGWELVTVTPSLPYVPVTTSGRSTYGNVKYTNQAYYFKRRVP